MARMRHEIVDLMGKLEDGAGLCLSYEHARNRPRLETGPSLEARPHHESDSPLWP